MIEVFKASEKYCDGHIAFSEKIFHQAHKECWVDCRKSIEKEHPKLDLIFLDYEDEDEDEDGEEVHIASELSFFEKENVAEPPSSSTADAGHSELPSDILSKRRSEIKYLYFLPSFFFLFFFLSISVRNFCLMK